MTDAYILMTALPPTTGHMDLIRFAANLPVQSVNVLVVTQPFEPYPRERFEAVVKACKAMPSVNVNWYPDAIEQDPLALGFFDMWKDMMHDSVLWSGRPARPGDYFVASENYGQTMADLIDGIFIPYDIGRELNPVRATAIRAAQEFSTVWDDILPEFRPTLQTRVTVFGAESTGKTTLSKAVHGLLNGWCLGSDWLFEWARPYLETVGPDITLQSMTNIWHGQNACQIAVPGKSPILIQDTDLYSTIGYWEQPHWESDLGPVPDGLLINAEETKSDLYIITKSNIPFEEDPIRYGGDRRESSDDYWIGVAEKYSLPYVVLDETDLDSRTFLAVDWVVQKVEDKMSTLAYDRKGF